ncbi:MAG: RDD family protein [Candidatus Limnocylindria bacterium]
MASIPATTAVLGDKVGFLPRALALIIDWILLAIVTTILASLAGGDATRSSGISTLLGLAYFLYFWSSYGKGQTLGMRALNIRVVKTDGSQLDLIAALIRYVGLIISFVVLFIGVLWVIFDAQKQGWHDKIASTYVVKA